MPTTNSATGATVTLKAGETLNVSTTGEAFVDLLTGMAGAGYTSIRVTDQFSRQIGPYADSATVRVRSVSGTASYESHAESAAKISPLVPPMLARANRSRMLTAPLNPVQQVFTNIASRTWQITRETLLPFDGIRVILLHPDPAALAGIKVAAAAGPDYVGDKLGNGLTWVNGTFGGQATGTLQAGAVGRPGITMPDVIPVTSVPRTDGREGYVSYVRLYTPTAGSAPLGLHNAGNYQHFNNLPREASFATHTDGDKIADTATMAVTGGTSSPIWGIEYLVQGNVVSTLAVGSSTFGAFGSANVPYGMNFTDYGCRASSMRDGVTAFASANFGLHGQTTAQYLLRLQDALAAGLRPQVVAWQVFSSNDYASTALGITDDLISKALARTQTVLELAAQYNFVPVLATSTPTATAKGWSAAADRLRAGLTDLLRGKYSKLALVVDLDGMLTDGGSPANIRPEYRLPDLLHPNSAGQELCGTGYSSQVLSPLAQVFA